MTGDEMERAIKLLIQSQENLKIQIAETNKVVQLQAATQTQFIQLVTRHLEAQAEINASLRTGNASLREAIARMDARIDRADARIEQTGASVDRTDARLDRIEALVERYLEGRSNVQG